MGCEGAFSRAARNAAAKLVTHELIDGALRALGDEANLEIAHLSIERRTALASRFVRNLRGASTARAYEVERLVLHAVEALPAGVHVLPICDAMSMVAARNRIGQVVTHLGWPWAARMKLQALVCEVVRVIAAAGGGVFETAVAPRGTTLVFEHASRMDTQSPCLADLRAVGIEPSLARDARGERLQIRLAECPGALSSARAS